MVLMLLEQIVQLFLCIVLGWLLVRLHLLKPEDSRVLSKVCLYLVTPCVIINAFQLQRTPELLQGLALSLGAAIGIHALFFIATALLHRPLRLTPVEQASLIYTNSDCGPGAGVGHLLQHVSVGAAVSHVESLPDYSEW